MQIEIKVEQKHIDNGQASSPSSCPVALAVEEQHPDLDCLVGTVAFNYRRHHNEDYKEVLLPYEASEKICAFDDGNGMKPFAFCVEISDAA